jgi:hypothetical protein
MRIDITDWDVNHNIDDFTQVLTWLDNNISKSRYGDKSGVRMQADTWRIYSFETSVEGFYETEFWLEFDNEHDATTFLLRWS